MTENTIHVHLSFPPSPGRPRRECLAALPLDGSRASLLNMSFYVPLCLADVVRTAPDPRGGQEVIALEQPSDMVLTWTDFADHVTQVQQQEVADRLREAGAEWSEGGFGTLATAWPGEMEVGKICRTILAQAPFEGAIAHPSIYTPAIRDTHMACAEVAGPFR